MPIRDASAIAVVGSGVSGLSAAWLLSRRHRVTLFEADGRLGGHGNTVDAPPPAGAPGAGATPVDTGFIVYNERTYPNLTAMFGHLAIPTMASDMSFAVSLDGGALEYAGTDLRGLLAQPANALRPRFWSMMRDLLRFYREAPRDLPTLGATTLGDYLADNDYGAAFREDHLYPMAAAIWSTPAGQVGAYPAAAFVRFCATHGLLQLTDRPVWRTVEGGARVYVERLARDIDEIVLNARVTSVRRNGGCPTVVVEGREPRAFDHVVLAAHADQTLAMLDAPSAEERRILSAFRYGTNSATLHRDPRLMPRRRAAWASWNYVADRRAGAAGRPCVTYWMNNLQAISSDNPLFVTLNAVHEPAPDTLLRRIDYDHPIFDAPAIAAQDELWSLQGRGNVWYCGAYFGAGFHEDGLQAGLAVAEQLGGARRPWSCENESGRIRVGPAPAQHMTELAS